MIFVYLESKSKIKKKKKCFWVGVGGLEDGGEEWSK